LTPVTEVALRSAGKFMDIILSLTSSIYPYCTLCL
jgi:hypothetical protein